MKCPKCGYISFDYNQACPKCKKGLTQVREKMNHFSFSPTFASQPGLEIQDRDDSVVIEQKTGIDLEESMDLESQDSQDFEIRLDAASEQVLEESDMELSLENESDDLSLDFDELSIDVAEPEAPQMEGVSVTEESIEADLDLAFQDDEFTLDFDDLSIDAADEPSLEVEELALDDADSRAQQLEEIAEGDMDLEIDLTPGEDPDVDKTAILGSTEEKEKTAAFDLADVSIAEAGTDTDVELTEEKGDQISLDPEESVFVMEEKAKEIDPSFKAGEEKRKDASSELELLDLDLDLDNSEDKSS